MPTADGQMYADEFIQEVISIDRLRHLNFDLSAEGFVLASAEFWKDHNDVPVRRFSGSGKTMGFALKALRERIRDHYGR
jgi:hypothetical protein